jgi:hypothetical protein
MTDGASGASARMGIQQSLQLHFIADYEESTTGMTFGGERKASHHHGRGIIPAHGIHGQGKRLRHRSFSHPGGDFLPPEPIRPGPRP